MYYDLPPVLFSAGNYIWHSWRRRRRRDYYYYTDIANIDTSSWPSGSRLACVTPTEN